MPFGAVIVVKRCLILVGALGCTMWFVAVLCANTFPDQTWKVLNRVEREYSDIVSRMAPIPVGTQRSVEEEKIFATAFRDLIGWHAHWQRRLFFLEVNGKDPTDDVLARLSETGSRVNKASQAYFDKRVLSGPLDRATREPGITLSMGSIKWLFGDRVEVSARMNCGSLCGQGGVYRLVKHNGLWTVDRYENHFFE